jgi:nucleoside-diphosphate-sugar epimerase
MKKAFITGASGFVGSHLMTHLLNSGWKVHCLLHHSPLLPDHSRRLDIKSYANLRTHLTLPAGLESFDVVFHIAGVLGRKGLVMDDYRKVHVDLTERLLQRIGNSSRTRFVYMSSAYVEQPEKDYELTKLEGEKLVKTYSRNWAIVRPGFVYGPRDRHLLPLFRLADKLWWCFPMVGGGDNIVAPTYVDDVVNALVDAANGNTGDCGKIVPVAGTWMLMRRFVAQIGASLGHKLITVPVPAVGVLKNVLRTDFFTRERAFQTYKQGTNPVIGLRRTVDWYREQHWL